MIPLRMLILLAAAGIPAAAGAGQLVSGPMLGHTATRAATIWLQADGLASAQVEYWPAATPEKRERSDAVTLVKSEDFTGKITLTDLLPGERYAYRLLLDGQPATTVPLTFATPAVPKRDQSAPDFKVALGSCNYIRDPLYGSANTEHGGGHEIFGAISRQSPNLVLWLGDNVYYRGADFDSPSGLAFRWRHDRATPELQSLLQTGSHYAVWDDHDYGPNNANHSYVLKGEALKLFQRYWANPSYGLPETPGTFTAFRHHDAEFFLLDDRWYRDSDREKNAGNRQMFGPDQMRWLKNALLASTARFKFIVGGSQMLYTTHPGAKWAEGWQHFPSERDSFLNWLAQHTISGVVFLSGDRHFTGLYRHQRPIDYPLYELTCSPLTSNPVDREAERTNPQLVEGTYVGRRNFCTIEFSGEHAGERTLTFKSFSSGGEIIWQHTIPAAALSQPMP